MNKYIGIIMAVLGATALTFAAIFPLITLPTEGLNRWFDIFGLLTASLTIGVIINVGPFLSLRHSENSKQEAEQLYLTVRDRLRPLLLGGLEDMLRRRISSLPANLSERSGYEKNLKFYVFAQVEGYHRVIASTVDVAAPVRRIALELDHGIVGYAFKYKKAILADSLYERRTIYDRYFKSIGQQQAIDSSTLEKCDIAVQFICAMPIFESKQDVPWSDKVIGVLTVDSTQAEDAALFQKHAFQKEVEEIAADVSPYLAVFEEIKRKSE